MFGSEFFACFLVIFLLAFTNTGGLGGGGIIVPTMMGLFRFDTRNAVSISNFSIATSTAVRYFMNLREPHPLKSGNGTLNDYGVTLLMLPSIVIGASLGAIVNLSLPGPIICAGFICCNIVTAGIGLRNFFKVRKAENAKKIIQAPVVEMEDRASVAENEDNQDKAVAEDSEESKEQKPRSRPDKFKTLAVETKSTIGSSEVLTAFEQNKAKAKDSVENDDEVENQ